MKKIGLFEYLKLRYVSTLLIVLACILFPLIQFLYGFHTEAVTYGVAILLFLYLTMSVIDYLLLRSKHIKLQERKQNMSVYSTHNVSTYNFIEEDYEATINRLYDIAKETMDSVETRYKEQIEYFTMWVHQIKTPISAMTLLVDDENLDPEIKSALRLEIFKVEQYATMVLDYLRIDNLNQDLILSPYQLDGIVKRCVKKYSTIFIHKHNSLDISTLPSIVKTDERWLMFLIEQILSNALKYTNHGTIHIYEEKTDNRVALVIEDTGIGIREEDIPRIFEQGYTGLNGRAYQKATGIGLYLSKKVADKLSCKICVSSKIHVGTKISILFPNEEMEFF